MTPSETKAVPVRGEAHQALAVFMGRWRAEGESYGSPKQAVEAPKRVTELGSALTPASGTPGSCTFENHGFYRHYEVVVEGKEWTVTGETERARIQFSEDGKTQTITWEWRPGGQWLPLCDRVARRLE